MKVLLIEDDEANIQQAMKQLAGNEITIMRTCVEVLDNNNFYEYDVVVTDLSIPIGDLQAAGYSDRHQHNDTEILPCGLAILFRAIACNVPFVLLSDLNGHRDMWGVILSMLVGYSVRAEKPRRVFGCVISEDRTIDTSLGKAKDWANAIRKAYPYIRNMIKEKINADAAEIFAECEAEYQRQAEV